MELDVNNFNDFTADEYRDNLLRLGAVSNSYCVKRHMFFAVTNPIIEDNLTKEQAEVLCKKLNDEELDDTYVHYEVHNCC